MDLGGPQLLTNILTPEELKETPTKVQEKLKNYLVGFFDEYCKEKAAANRLHDYEKRTEELDSQIKDYEVKLSNYNQNVLELRSQLDTVSMERARLLEEVSAFEKQLTTLRSEKNSVGDERDSLMKVIERQNSELERVLDEKRSCEQQLKNAIVAKCEAIARVDEIDSKEVSLEFKERRMEQERSMLHNQIQTLSEDLNRNINELQNMRRDNTMQSMHLEARFTEKAEELKIAQTQCNQYKETIDRLTQNVQELTTKMLCQNEEANKMMDYYKKELEAKTKLADLYRNNCDDTVMERTELESGISDLKRMLSLASDEYGQLETKLKATVMNHEQELEEKDKLIESQKAELNHANDLLKDMQNESVENAISKLAPSAAVASRLIRADMSLTELYSLYVKTSEELEVQKRENSRMNLQLKTILQELTENAPIIKKQEVEYEKLVETNNILVHQRDEMQKTKIDMEESMMDAVSKINHLERDNKKLRHSQNDLSRQVCYLLKEVEQLRIGIIPDNSGVHYGNLSTTDEVISKKLVTFGSMSELQDNNQKLLLLVRDLSTKLEETEVLQRDFDNAGHRAKLESYMKKVQVMQDTLNKQNNTVATLVAKCERYKRMFFGVQKQLNKSGEGADLSDLDDDSNAMDATDGQSGADGIATDVSGQAKRQSTDSNNADRRVRCLEQQLKEVKDHYKTLKEQHEYYAQEKKNNEKILNEQFDSMRTEVRELTSTNCKLMSAAEYTTEQIKLQQRNIATFKQQIAALEERNRNYETTIVKHEQTVVILKDEVLKSQRGHSAADSEANHLRHENMQLKATVSRLQVEKEGIHREQQSQNLLLNNLELIKSNLERSESEGRIRLEQRLDDTVRELSAQRRRFQEEEDRFRELTADLKRQTETAQQRQQEEHQHADKVRGELAGLREELAAKVRQVDDLSKKLQESLTPVQNDNPIALANKKAREYELKYEEARIEMASLATELAKARQHAEQYYKMSQSAETEIKNLHDVHTASVTKAEAEMKQLRLAEANWKSQVAQLEAEAQLSAITESATPQQPEQLQKTHEELKDALQKLTDCNRNLRKLRAENNALAESLNAVETKYANEMVLHSADIQDLSKIKAELIKVQDEINGLQNERDTAKAAYAELKDKQDESFRRVRQEKEELDQRITDMNSLNSNLHDQIEALSAKLNALSQMQTVGAQTTHVSANDSLMDTSDPNRSASNVEDEAKGAEKLLQVIKFLRKEKDLMVAKVDILLAESTRLQSENTILQKKIDELKACMNVERTRSETSIVSAAKHEEILRKIETLNAMTDSNRILREERNTLAARVKELNERISMIENDLFPLQKQNSELGAKIEEISSENTSLRTEAIKWRQRANVLVEKSNKNPEEFKRLQMERENLAKMLTNEKDALKQAVDQLNASRAERARLENELAAHERQIHALSDEKKKADDNFAAQKQNNIRIVQEVMELKNKLLEKEETVQKLSTDLDAKEVQLQESKNKEVQIRKIAKRYKDSYLEQVNKTSAAGGDPGSAAGLAAGEGMELGANSGGGDAGAAASAAELEQYRATIESLNGVTRSLQEENEKLRKDFDDLKSAVEIDERTKALLREAKSRIVAITESKNALVTELANTKTKLQAFAQTAEGHETALGAIKSQYEQTFARMEKELVDQNNLSKEAIARLTRENESLLMRINHLGRQLGLQQSAKPSTSSVTITDKGCISESSSPRTANVKPMSGSANVQQSASVTPRRGGETPLASIRPISVQNSRTAAILPTSQQQTPGGGSTVAATSASTSGGVVSANTPSSAGSSSNTALVPPQQQVHTTGGSSTLETMSSSPTSSHTDYMPSTSSASVAVAAIPPMGSSASAAESSQEAESIQQAQQPNESQLLVSGGQQQVVALVSPRVEGSTQNAPSPNMQHGQQQQEPNSQQPSTSASTSSTSHIAAVSSHSRHTPSSSSVTTSQAGSSGGGHKRPRDVAGDSSTGVEDGGGPDKGSKHPKRMRTPNHQHGAEAAMLVGITDSDLDVEYQVPTSSQRDQEDDIVEVDSDDEEEEEDGMVEAADAEHEGYEDSYEQDPEEDMDEEENDGADINEANVRGGSADVAEADNNNEVDVDDDGLEKQVQCRQSGITDNQAEPQPALASYATGASTSQAAAAAAVAALAQDSPHHQQQQQQQQQSQAISSGSYEPANVNNNTSNNIPQSGVGAMQQWKQQPQQQATTSTLTRQQKATLMMLQQGSSMAGGATIAAVLVESIEGGIEALDAVELVSSPQGSKFSSYGGKEGDEHDTKALLVEQVVVVEEGGIVAGLQAEQSVAEDYSQKKAAADEAIVDAGTPKASGSGAATSGSGSSSGAAAGASTVTVALEVAADDSVDVDEDYIEEVAVASIDVTENVDSESHHSSGATQSEMQDIQQNQVEELEGADGVSSEGEKQAVEEIEEEGREAEATTSPPITTRSKALRGAQTQRRPNRGVQRGGRPTPIVWQESPGNSRNTSPSHRNNPDQQLGGNLRGGYPQQRTTRGRRMRRPTGPNYGGGGNIRYN